MRSGGAQQGLQVLFCDVRKVVDAVHERKEQREVRIGQANRAMANNWAQIGYRRKAVCRCVCMLCEKFCSGLGEGRRRCEGEE